MELHFKKRVIVLSALVLVSGGCGSLSDRAVFNPKTCPQEVPKTVPGVRVISGPRGEQNIIADMQSSYCNAQMLFMLMNKKGPEIAPGQVIFQVTVEYTGEAIAVEVVQSTIDSAEYLWKVTDMIRGTDFSPWARHDDDAVFVYPMTFTNWWKE